MTPSRELQRPDDAAFREAFEIVRREAAHQFEASRQEREAKIRQQVADWHFHAECCEQRGADYATQAARFPLSHKDHGYFLRLANEQFKKAAEARRWADIEGASL